MKKKLALFMALVITLSLAPVSVFAASSNRLSRDTRIVPKETLLYDPTITASDAGNAYHSLTGAQKTKEDNTISNYVSGMDLVLEFKDKIHRDDAFRLNLENAEWFFEYDMDTHAKSADRAIAYNSARMASGGAYSYVYKSSAATTEIPYRITVSPTNRSSATIRFDVDGFNYETLTPDTKDRVLVPLCVYIPDEDVDVTVRLTDNASPATTGSWLIASSRAGATTTAPLSIKSGRESIALDTLVIKENRSGSLNTAGGIELIAPAGYRFRDKFSSDKEASRISIRSEYGLGAITAPWGYKWTDTRENTSIALYIATGGTSTDKIPGSILISGLEIEPVDYDSTPRIGETLTMSIANYENSSNWITMGTRSTDYTATNAKLNVKDETFDVAKVVDWAVTMTAAETRTLVGGRFPDNPSDEKIKAAKVTMSEEEIGSWLIDRVTNFTLPEGIKIRALKFDTRTNLTSLPSGLYDIEANAVVNASRYTEDFVTFTDRGFTLRGVKPDSATAKSKLEFTLYLSIDPNFEGPITLTANGTALPQEDQTVTIAEALPPIIITSRSKNVQIGYQNIPVNDIIITETVAGALQREGDLHLKPYDYTGANDILFQAINETNFKVTEGNVHLYLHDTRNGILSFTVDRASTTPSTIELTGLSVRAARSVPYGVYDVTAYGSAIFENYNFDLSGSRVKRDLVSFFKEDEGIILPGYIQVASEGANLATQNNVKITASSNIIVVGGETAVLDVAPFIDPETNSFLVPLRFVAMALGIPETNVFWDQATSTATIISADNSRTVQFTAGSDVMLVNGARQSMITNDYHVKARIVDSRMFIPFRYVGVGLGIPNERIVWNESSQSAEFNPVSVD